MYICVDCKIQMRCEKNSVGADFGSGHVFPADKFICPRCEKRILATNPNPIFDPEYKTQDEYERIDG